MAISIDSHYIEPDGEVEITENFNRIAKTLFAETESVYSTLTFIMGALESLDERVSALEG